ncbi:Pepsin A-4 [Clonorchis sinensis]|uniref:Pepsin A-4 n=1 Tax=Clonorchis sinensis TaxID=79923 RepID=A0A8T1MWD5_CLOSI|nr:Pepsin A-4 [Clonorchis sinensis]
MSQFGTESFLPQEIELTPVTWYVILFHAKKLCGLPESYMSRMRIYRTRKDGSSGTVIFGDISKAHIPGTINYVPVIENFGNKDEWIIEISSITREDGTVLASKLSALLDTGAYRTYLPTLFVDRLFSGIWEQMDLGNLLVRCDAMRLMPTLLVNLGGHQLKWEPSQYIEQLESGQCRSTIQPANLPLSYNALMGISFLRYFSVVYDVDNEVVGFAEPI